MALDAQNGKFIGAYPLKKTDGTDYFGHAGGLTASEDYIYITSESTCYICEIDNLKSLKMGKRLCLVLACFVMAVGMAFAQKTVLIDARCG